MYSALYRRLRPRIFADIYGQEHIVRTLKNQISSGRASHAYLFCGTRGTGKTSTALVFAKAINCETPNDGEPCGTCAACEAIARGTGFNVIEIDAASNNGVDNIRDIREEVKYPPAEGRYKVYIIDEAHMLSTSAFNALLKTLEEPPAGVVFILATTDPQKIPPTVHSRCQRFDFKRIPLETMVTEIEKDLLNEGIICDTEAVRYAARAADGSVRDALSILDQCASYYINERVTLERIMEISGAAGTDALSELLSAISEKNAAECLSLVDNFIRDGKDIHQLTSEFLSFLRDSLIARAAGNSAARILDLSEEKIQRLRNGAANLPADTLTRYIASFSELISKMRYAGNPRILLEAEIIGFTQSFENKKDIVKEETKEVKKPEKKEEKPKAEEKKPEPGNDFTRITAEWDRFIAGLDAMERSLFLSTTAEYTGGNHVRIVCQNTGVYDILKTKRERVRAGIMEKYGLDADVEFILRKK